MADKDSTFSAWSGGCSGTSSCVVSMAEARSVTAEFSEDFGYEVFLPLEYR
jgi:hypothetical protein